jgi:hypothetical protein
MVSNIARFLMIILRRAAKEMELIIVAGTQAGI